MYRYDCNLDIRELNFESLLLLYNKQFYKKLSRSELEKLIEQHIAQSNADHCIPICSYKHNQLTAFCIIHIYEEERIKDVGNLTFSLLISDLKENTLKILFNMIFKEIKLREYDFKFIVGPIHNSILIPRGYRFSDDNIYTYGMPDNYAKIATELENSGAIKKKDIIEIVYKYKEDDVILTSLDKRILNRLSNIQFHIVNKKEISKINQEISEAYNNIWNNNWGFSKITPELISIAAENIPNVMGLIAKKNNNIIGFTMMQHSENIGRAFMAGVLDSYKNSGLSIALISSLSKIAIEKGIYTYSIGWMLENNISIINTMKKFTKYGNSKIRKYRIYEINLNNN